MFSDVAVVPQSLCDAIFRGFVKDHFPKKYTGFVYSLGVA